MGIKSVQRILLAILLFSVFIFASGCASNEYTLEQPQSENRESKQISEEIKDNNSKESTTTPSASYSDYEKELYLRHPIAEEWNHHAAIIDKNGALWMWGSNTYGQLGNGDVRREDMFSPIQIMDDVVSASAGRSCTFAIKNDGSLWA